MLTLFAAVALAFSFNLAAAPKKQTPVCLQMVDHGKQNPFDLKGRLAVTYIERSINPEEGDQHELGVFQLGDPTAKLKRLSHNLVNESEVEISPDGTKFLYTVRPWLDQFHGRVEFWQMNMDGTGRKAIFRDRNMSVPAWLHPSNDEFLFIKWPTNQPSRFYTGRASTGKMRRFPGQLRNPADPEVSYDGKLITFKMPVEGDNEFQPSIYVMNRDGSNIRRLTRGFSDHDPVFSLNGSKIYFERYYGPGDWFEASQDRSVPEHNWWGLVEVDVNTGAERVLVPHDPCGRHFFWLPTISPDGQYVMYIHIDVWGEENGVPWTDLWVIDRDGRHAQKVPGSDWFYFFDWAK